MRSIYDAFRLYSTRTAFLVAVVSCLGMSFVPILAVHGVESALLFGILLPPFTGVIGTRLVIVFRRQQLKRDTTSLLMGAMGTSLILLCVPIVLLALNSFWIRNCTPLQGLGFFLLGPGVGMNLSAIAGVLIGAWIPLPQLATILAALLPVLGLGAALYDFYSTPAVFAYGHFFGYFPGSIYDEEITIPTALIMLRLVSLAISLGCVSLLMGCYDGTTARFRLCVKGTKTMVWLLVGFLCFSIAIIAEAKGYYLGYRTSFAWLAEQLETQVKGKKCTAYFPREVDVGEAQRLTEECDFRINQAERFLGVSQRENVSAFYFRSSEEKKRLTGAYTTYIAKPWLNAVFLQLTHWPHPIVGHEIAHVVAANIGSGPFRISGLWGGLWPNFGIIEGLAVAASWSSSNQMTPHQWARAMIELGLAPPLEDTMGARFLYQPKRRAYILAGSFIRFIKEKYGTKTIQRIYRRGDISTLPDIDFHTMKLGWQQYISSISLPDSAHTLAKDRFSRRNSVFTAVCPHRIARLHSQLDSDLSASNYSQVSKTCRKILHVQPYDSHAQAILIASIARRGEISAAKREVSRLKTEFDAPLPVILKARQEIADAFWRKGETSRAIELYVALSEEPQSEDATRLLQVKKTGLEVGGEQSNIFLRFLLDHSNRSTDGAISVYLARELRRFRSDGLPHYLEGRQLFFRQHYDSAAKLFHSALQKGLPSEQLRIEALKLAATAQFAIHHYRISASLWERLTKENVLVHQIEAKDWLERIEYTKKLSRDKW